MGRRSRRRGREDRSTAAVREYSDDEGNVLVLRDGLSQGTRRELERLHASAAASQEDMYARRAEFLFERLAVSWTIAGLPLTGQKELLGRLRMSDAPTRDWVRRTVDEHFRSIDD